MIGSTNSIWDVKSEYEQLVNYTMLYDYGDECTDITGGWEKAYQYYSTSMNGSSGVVAKNENSISVTGTTKAYGSCGVATNQKIDNTNYSKLAVLYSEIQDNVASEIFWITTTNDRYSNSERIWIGPYYPSDLQTSPLATFDMTPKTNNRLMLSTWNGNGTITYLALALFKADDWLTLSEKAGITATSIDDILTNSGTLLTNKEAVEFMIYNCTGDFMASAIKSETFLTALNNSPYKTKILANEHWAKFLSMVA